MPLWAPLAPYGQARKGQAPLGLYGLGPYVQEIQTYLGGCFSVFSLTHFLRLCHMYNIYIYMYMFTEHLIYA